MIAENIIHIWLTQHALTKGVFEHNAERCNGTMVRVVGRNCSFDGYYHKPHWHTSKAEADAQVRKMIESKIKSLKKSLAKMEKLQEEYRASDT